jgi:hypothetical protein
MDDEARLRSARPTCKATSDLATYSDDELEFLRAMDRYKRERRRPYPTWTEVLAVLKSLGYGKTTPE